MRVITGTARGRKLSAPDGLETRPTPEMVKESVFNIIQFEIEGASALDLFAGSGQMGIEALSRGARACVFVDQSRTCRAAIDANLTHTGFSGKSQVFVMDAFSYVQSSAGGFDIAFVDPPYGKGALNKLLEPISRLMSTSGVIICETGAREELPVCAGDIKMHKQYRYGQTLITVYRSGTEE